MNNRHINTERCKEGNSEKKERYKKEYYDVCVAKSEIRLCVSVTLISAYIIL